MLIATLWRGAALLATALAPALAPPPAPRTPRTPNVVTIVARDFAFDGPASIPAGTTTLRLVNRGQEVHHVQLLRLEQGKTVADVAAALEAKTKQPTWMVDAGGPNAAAPGDTSAVTMRLASGQYAIVCFVDTPDRVPHFMKGMTRALTVTPASGPEAPLPTPDATLTLRDYGFQFSAPLTAGAHLIRVTNAATQSHEALLVQFAPGKSMKDFQQWSRDYKGPPPGRPLGGLSAVRAGNDQYLRVDLTPGAYGLICFVSDAKDGKPHIAHGMVREFRVE